MTDAERAAAPAETAVETAVETLTAELEREHEWLSELRQDAERAERSCQCLLTAIEAALDALPLPQRRPFYIRIMRMRNEVRAPGRPPRDGRRAAILDLLAERGDGTITNAECRAHIERLGLDGNSGYVGRMLATMAQDGLVTRLSMGRYAINGTHDRLRSLRWRKGIRGEIEATKEATEVARAEAERRRWIVEEDEEEFE